MSILVMKPVAIDTGSDDQDGRLVLADGRLVAVLVRLADLSHADQAGHWFLEAGFGRCASTLPPVFDSLDAARDWLNCRLEG